MTVLWISAKSVTWVHLPALKDPTWKISPSKPLFLKPVSCHLPSRLYCLLDISSFNQLLLTSSHQSPVPTFHPDHVPFAPHFPPTLLLVCLLSCALLSHKARFLFDILHVSIVHFFIFACLHSHYFFFYLSILLLLFYAPAAPLHILLLLTTLLTSRSVSTDKTLSNTHMFTHTTHTHQCTRDNNVPLPT